MQLKISVTKEDIAAGEHHAGEFDSCPIAVALKRIGCEEVDADEDRILVSLKGNRYLYKTPRNAMLFISDFDSGQESYVKPIEFVLEKPRLAMIEDERRSLYDMTVD